MAVIPVEKKSKGIPWWVWLAGALAIFALLFAFTRKRGDGAALAEPHEEVTAGQAGLTGGSVPQDPATTAKTCTNDDACGASELCLDGACRGIAANATACSAATVNFATDSADVGPAQKTSIERLARCLRADRSMKLKVEGAADARGTSPHNDALADRRAHAVARELQARGVSAAQLHVVSYGENQLLCRDDDESCWAKNRRTEVRPQ